MFWMGFLLQKKIHPWVHLVVDSNLSALVYPHFPSEILLCKNILSSFLFFINNNLSKKGGIYSNMIKLPADKFCYRKKYVV